MSARARTLATGRCSSAVLRPGRLHIARQTGPFCTVQLAVAEGTAVAPNGGSASILPRPSSPLSVMLCVPRISSAALTSRVALLAVRP